jgi:glycosyltransferase involved in cell wall biosynthesis
MNIGIDVRALQSKNFTGVGNYLYHALDNIFKLDKEEDYYLLSAGLKNEPQGLSGFNYPQVHHHHCLAPNKLINIGILTGFGPDLCRQAFHDLDLFWLPNLNFFKFNRRVPVVLTIHDLSFLHNPKFYSWKRIWWHNLVNVKKLVNRASKIIAVSHNTKRDIINFFNIPEEKITVIYPGVNVLDMNRELAQQLTAKFNLPAKYFIYVGTLEPRKNIEAILKAMARYHQDWPEAELIIIGAKGWLYKNILADIKSKNYIRYLEYVESPLKDALYFLSQGLLWPSFYEGFGFPPLEATYYGVPVVTSFRTSLPEIMKQQALYVDPYNVSDLYQIMVLLTTDENLRQQLIKEDKKVIIPTWPAQVAKILEVFKSLK